MKENYQDWQKWVRVEHESKHFGQYEEFTVEGVVDLLKDLEKQAIEANLEGIHFSFESTMEPYENCLGDPKVTVVGYRPHSKRELKEQRRQKHIQEFADRKGISFYEANIALKLIKGGVVSEQ